MRFILCFLIFVCVSNTIYGQYVFFPSSGRIIYESKFHVQNYIKRNVSNNTDLGIWTNLSLEAIQKSGIQEVITKHELKFSNQESVFSTIKEEYPSIYNRAMRYLPFINEAKTYINYSKQTYSRLLPFGDEELLLADTLPKVKWKYTDEYRQIAGYDCRRANGIIQDSIYVVAFFTNQLELPVGPALIHGLPGTILGASIPSLNLSIFASKIELNNDVVSSTLTKKKKVVPESREIIIKKLKTLAYDWMNDKAFQKELSKVFF